MLKKIIFTIAMIGIIILMIPAISAYAKTDTDIISQEKTERIHQCNWEDCDHQGEVIDQHSFVSLWGYDEMTDGWCVEMTHYTNPSWTYEQCEDYVFSGVE